MTAIVSPRPQFGRATARLGGWLRGLRSALLSAMVERVARRLQFDTVGVALRRALYLSINGIAAAMQSTG